MTERRRRERSELAPKVRRSPTKEVPADDAQSTADSPRRGLVAVRDRLPKGKKALTKVRAFLAPPSGRISNSLRGSNATVESRVSRSWSDGSLVDSKPTFVTAQASHLVASCQRLPQSVLVESHFSSIGSEPCDS